MKEKFYHGAYPSGYSNNTLTTSLSGQTIKTNVSWTPNARRNAIHAKGTGYEMQTFYQKTYFCAMFILKYKTLNSDAITGVSFASAESATGTGNAKGMDWVDPTSNGGHTIKMFGIEAPWHTMTHNCYFDGIGIDTNGYFRVGTDKFDGTAASLEIATGVLAASAFMSTQNYIDRVVGSTKLGFCGTRYGGSASTYFCDQQGYKKLGNTYNYTGGPYELCGMFCLFISYRDDSWSGVYSVHHISYY